VRRGAPAREGVAQPSAGARWRLCAWARGARDRGGGGAQLLDGRPIDSSVLRRARRSGFAPGEGDRAFSASPLRCGVAAPGRARGGRERARA